MKRGALLGLMCLLPLVTSCGGASGDEISVSLNPTSISATYYQNDAQEFDITAVAKVSGEINTVYVVVEDPTGLLSYTSVGTGQNPNTYDATLVTSITTSPGHYQGNFQILLCGDQNCTTRFGSTSLAYNFTVLSDTNLTPLSALPSASDWTMFQGNSQHTGVVPITLDPTQFSHRWLWHNPNQSSSPPQTTLYPLVTSGGSVFVAGSAYYASGFYAINESDGSLSWNTYGSFGQYFQTYAPTYDRGTIFSTGQQDNSSTIIAMDANTGTVTSNTASFFSGSQLTISGNQILSPDGGRVTSYSRANTTTQNWHSQYIFWQGNNVAAQGGFAYAYGVVPNGGGTIGHAELTQFDLATGNIVLDLPDPIQTSLNGSSSNAATGQPVVIDANNVLINAMDHMTLFSTQQQQAIWAVNGTFIGTPVASQGVIYVESANPTQLLAISQVDGHVLWTWAPKVQTEQPFNSNIIATNNLVFLSTDKQVYAVDLASRKTVWSYAHAGGLAISANGILYIMRIPNPDNPLSYPNTGILSINSPFHFGIIPSPSDSYYNAYYSDGSIAAINLH